METMFSIRGEKSMYKLLVLDVDGTLLNDEGRISPRNKEAIRKAQDRGVKVILASGRMFFITKKYADQLNLETPLITYNGALIKDKEDRIISHTPVPLGITFQVISFTRKKRLHLNTYFEDTLYIEEENRFSRYYQNRYGVTPCVVLDLLKFYKEKKKSPTKLLVIIEPGEMEKWFPLFQEKFSDKLYLTQSEGRHIELLHPQVSKVFALKKIVDLYRIKREEIIAIGDGVNDIEMIKYAGLGVAMENSSSLVKEVAEYIAPSNTKDGVAETIERFILNKSGK